MIYDWNNDYEMIRSKNTVYFILSLVVIKIVCMQKEYSYGRKVLKLHCETKQYTTWSDVAFCGAWSGSALFTYELPPNISSAYNLCGQSRPRAGLIGPDSLIL